MIMRMSKIGLEINGILSMNVRVSLSTSMSMCVCVHSCTDSILFKHSKLIKSQKAPVNQSPTISCPVVASTIYTDKEQVTQSVTWNPATANDPEDGALR